MISLKAFRKLLAGEYTHVYMGPKYMPSSRDWYRLEHDPARWGFWTGEEAVKHKRPWYQLLLLESPSTRRGFTHDFSVKWIPVDQLAPLNLSRSEQQDFLQAQAEWVRWVQDGYAGDQPELPNSIRPRRFMHAAQWETKGADYMGYKVMRYDKGFAVSGADSRIRLPLRKGAIHRMPGQGIFLSDNPKYVLDYYAIHDVNVLIKYSFDPNTVIFGELSDRETEITVPEAKVEGFWLYDEEGRLIKNP